MKQPNTTGYYRKMLSAGPNKFSKLESTGDYSPDLSDTAIKNRLKYTKKELYRLIKKYYGNKPVQYEMADALLRRGDRALRIIRDQDEKEFVKSSPAYTLEAIVHTDGTRPSFFIRNGTVDLKSSSQGTSWESDLAASKGELDTIFPRIGRIDDPEQDQKFCGTGFLVHKNYMITNRHVLQLIASRDPDGKWNFNNKIFVDFTHEFRSKTKPVKRQLLNVTFAGPDPIPSRGDIDHRKLDLALIELEPATATNTPAGDIFFDISNDWAQPDKNIYLIGYPGSPERGVDSLTILEKLFQSEFGYKRLAPGMVVKNADGLPDSTFSHDATTLGGNSGSLVIIPGREKNSVGLHYGGRSSMTRVNWGHVLGATLAKTDGRDPKTLKQILENLEVRFIDRIIT
jgi:Trypsin-like peptidase domain